MVIVGGEMVGCETAEFLASRGKRVTLLARRERVGDDLGRSNRWVVMQRLRKAGVRMETGVDVVEITDKGVRGIMREGSAEFFPADSVVLATGMKPNEELAKELEGKVAAIHSIGDSVEPGRIADAIESGFRVAHKL